jgi:hypothetical protein
MNLFPGTEGILTPEWEVECPDGSIDEDSMDSDVMFDPNTCMTTCGCIKNAVSFEQKFVLPMTSIQNGTLSTRYYHQCVCSV